MKPWAIRCTVCAHVPVRPILDPSHGPGRRGKQLEDCKALLGVLGGLARVADATDSERAGDRRRDDERLIERIRGD